MLLHVLLLTSLGSPSAAQVVQVQAGSSSLFDAHGGSMSVGGRTFTATLGGGVLDERFTVGFLATKSWKDVTLSAGDAAVDFQLPTDVFGGSRYVQVRGAGAEWTRGPSRVRLLAGTTSETLGAPFFRGASADRPLGLLFYDRRLGERWQLFSRTALSRRQTSIHGLAFQPTRYFQAAIAAGAGNNTPYVAASGALDTARLQVSAAYIEQRSGFRRIETTSPMSAEPLRENIRVTLRPATWWSLSGGRQTFLHETADSPDRTNRKDDVTVNQLGGGFNVSRFRVAGSLYHAERPEGRHLGTSLSIGRGLGGAMDLVADYYRSDAGDARPSESIVLRLRETLSPRLSLSQAVSRTGGQTSVNFGGEFLSNPLRATVSYQTVYAPLRPGNPFVQVVGGDLRVSLFDWVTLQGGTYVTPTGRVRYTVSGTYLRSSGSRGWGGQQRSPALPKYLVKGEVRDTDDQPVAGVVIRLDREVVITNADGRFELRSAKRKRLRLEVVPEESMTPGRLVVVSAPETASAVAATEARDVLITVRRR